MRFLLCFVTARASDVLRPTLDIGTEAILAGNDKLHQDPNTEKAALVRIGPEMTLTYDYTHHSPRGVGQSHDGCASQVVPSARFAFVIAL